jgi:aryl-alcohol dehydrogenase-like predicted oxidoreductase
MSMTRRTFLAAGLGLAAAGRAAGGGGAGGGGAGGGGAGEGTAGIATRPIPRTGERIPVVGLGTWRTFDVGSSDADRAPLLEVLRRFLSGGGRVIDSSPMYGEAERVVGDLLARLPDSPRPFLATKVWTRGRAQGEAEMAESMRRLRVERLDLMQVHNLLDWREHLTTMRAWKAAGRIRYVGITHYAASAFAELESILRTERVDFVQLPYSAARREAETRLLPAAAETGTAVLVMRPFEEGELFRMVKGRPLPTWAGELGVTSWSEVFLRFILSHPAVTAVIPATSKVAHLEENLRAGRGTPDVDPALRRRMERDLRF